MTRIFDYSFVFFFVLIIIGASAANSNEQTHFFAGLLVFVGLLGALFTAKYFNKG